LKNQIFQEIKCPFCYNARLILEQFALERIDKKSDSDQKKHFSIWHIYSKVEGGTKSIAMLKNYIRIALRSYGKNYLFTIINVLGMAVGLSGLIVTFLLYDYEKGFDRQHKDTSSMYRVNTKRLIEGESQKWGVVPSTLGPIAAGDNPAIEAFSRYAQTRSFLVQHEEIVHREQISFADPGFFELFSFDMKFGSKEVFKDKSSVVISEQFARKYFGDENPTGRYLTIRKNDTIIHQFLVGAVAKKIPLNSSFRFGIIAQYENLLDFFGENEFDWTTEIRPVLYVKLNELSAASDTEKAIQKYPPIYNDMMESWKISSFYLVPFREQKDEARFVHYFTTGAGLPISALYGSIIMNALILLIACFNFTNTSLAYANKRLKEIGIRRTFGGVRSQIIKQFFIENFILCVLALLLSIEIANTSIAWMNAQWPIEISTFYFDNWNISINLMLLLLAVSFIAGAYPSFYVSRFHPTEILKGKLKLQGTNNFTRMLLTWQFGFSVMAIFSGVVLTQNAIFQKTMDWGFDKENALIIPLQEKGNYEVLRNELAKNQNIEFIAGTIHNVGYGSKEANIEIDGEKHNSSLLYVGDTYLPTIGCDVIQGRHFLQDSENDVRESIMVNQDFVITFDIRDPLNQPVFIDNKYYQIVGVVEDFMPYGLYDPIKPSILRPFAAIDYQQLVIRADEEKLPEIMASAQKSWKSLFPTKPFEGFFMEQAAAEALNTNNGILMQFGLLAFFALFLSVSGLYSTVSLTVNKRIKEIGIRKVMGASVGQIMRLLNNEFSIIILISTLIGCVGGYYFMNQFLSDIFTYHLDIGLMSYVAATFTIMLFTALTSGIRIYRAAMNNPTDSLRYE
jgi:putative ABC transport system permease protein